MLTRVSPQVSRSYIIKMFLPRNNCDSHTSGKSLIFIESFEYSVVKKKKKNNKTDDFKPKNNPKQRWLHNTRQWCVINDKRVSYTVRFSNSFNILYLFCVKVYTPQITGDSYVYFRMCIYLFIALLVDTMLTTQNIIITVEYNELS